MTAELSMAGEDDGYLLRAIKDLQNVISELHDEYREKQSPISDDSPALQRLCVKLEYLLQFDLKEKKTFFGNRKDYWDFISYCINKKKVGNDWMQLADSMSELKTSLGKGRGFIRYCLVQKRLADSLQLSFMDTQLTSDWYYARSPFLKDELKAAIIAHLYELNGIDFDLTLKGTLLDMAWPAAYGPSKVSNKMLNGTDNNAKPTFQVTSPQMDCEVALESLDVQKVTSLMSGQDEGHILNNHSPTVPSTDEQLARKLKEASTEYELKISSLEKQNQDLIDKVDRVLKDIARQQRAPDTSKDLQKIHELLDSLASSEKRELELRRLNLEYQSQIENLSRELQGKEEAVQDLITRMEKQDKDQSEKSTQFQQETDKTREAQKQQLEEQCKKAVQLEESNKFLSETVEEMDSLVSSLKDRLSAKEQAFLLLQKQHSEDIATLQKANLMELEKLKEAHKDDLNNCGSQQKNLEEQLAKAVESIASKELALNKVKSKLQDSEMEKSSLEKSRVDLEGQVTLLEEDKKNLMSERETLQQNYQQLESQSKTVQEKLRKSEQTIEELEQSRFSLQAEVSRLQASETLHLEQRNDSKLTLDEKEQKLREGKTLLEEKLRGAELQNMKLSQKLKGYQAEKEDIEKEKGELLQSLTFHQQGLKDAKLEVENLSKQVSSYLDQTASLKNAVELGETRIREKENDIKRLKAELEEMAKSLAEMQAEKSEVEIKLAERISEIEMLRTERTGMESQMSELTKKYEESMSEMKTQLSTLEKQMNEVLTARNSLHEEGLKQKALLQEVLEGKHSAETQLKSASDALEEKSLEVLKLRQEVEDIKQTNQEELGKLTKYVAVLEKERDTLAQQKKELERKSFDMDEEHLQLKYQMKKLELEWSKAQDTAENGRTELAQVNMHLQGLLLEKEEMEQNLSKVTAQLKQQHEDALKALQVELESLQNENQALKKTALLVSGLKEENQQLREKLKEAEGQVQNTENTLQQERAELKLKVTKEIEAHAAQLKAMKEDFTKLSEEKQSKIKALREKEDELQAVRNILNVAERESEELKNALETAKEEMKEKEENYKVVLDEKMDTIKNMKERVLELLREKDELWKKSDRLEFQHKYTTLPRDPNTCTRCNKDFKLLGKKYQCRSCRATVCPSCSTESGKKERTCLQCY